MSRIIIKNLCSITNFEMSIKNFNLIIGEQASGKSTICKAICFFRIIKENLIKDKIVNYILNKKIKDKNSIKINKENSISIIKEMDIMINDIFSGLFGTLNNIDNKLYLKYEYIDDIYIEIKIKSNNNKNSLVINYSKKVKQFLYKLYSNYLIEDIFHKSFKDFNNIINEILLEINNFFSDDIETYYIPATRSSFLLFNNLKTRLGYNDMDLLNLYFFRLIETLQNIFGNDIKKILFNKLNNSNTFKSDFENMYNKSIKYLNGEYIHKNGFDYIKLLEKYGKKIIPINYISSGQQEILWLLNILLELMVNEEKSFIIIEEPEAHLYPKMQKEIIDFIVNFMNITESIVLITTHSPYILTSCNNLLYAGKLKSKSDKNKKNVDKLIGKYGTINPKEINAIQLSLRKNKGGTRFINLLNKDKSQIKAEKIDEISDSINEIYTKLFDMELNDNE